MKPYDSANGSQTDPIHNAELVWHEGWTWHYGCCTEYKELVQGVPDWPHAGSRFSLDRAPGSLCMPKLACRAGLAQCCMHHRPSAGPVPHAVCAAGPDPCIMCSMHQPPLWGFLFMGSSKESQGTLGMRHPTRLAPSVTSSMQR